MSRLKAVRIEAAQLYRHFADANLAGFDVRLCHPVLQADTNDNELWHLAWGMIVSVLRLQFPATFDPIYSQASVKVERPGVESFTFLLARWRKQADSDAAVLALLDQLARGGVPNVAGVTPVEAEVIQALRLLNATSQTQATTTEKVAATVAGCHGDPNNFKRPVRRLVEAGIIESAYGRRGGIWLSPAGRRAAIQLP